jgi:hypothetical protein
VVVVLRVLLSFVTRSSKLGLSFYSSLSAVCISFTMINM